MNKDQIITLICSQKMPLEEECRSEFADLAAIKQVGKKELLIKEGEYNGKMYFVVEGTLRAFYLKDGNDVTDWFGFENEFICSIQNFFEGVPSPHYLEALSASTLLEISKENILYLSQKYRPFEQLGYFLVTETMLRLQKRIVSLQFETAQQKYLNLLKEYPTIELTVPLIHIASYLGITLETLSRVRNKKRKI